MSLLARAQSQLLVVDVQERLAPAMSALPELKANLERLARAAAILDVPVTLSEQYPKGLGATLPDVRAAFGTRAAVFAKTHFSCARDPALAERIEQIGRSQIVLCGIEAHVCVLQTAMDLRSAGRNPSVVIDACDSRRPESKAVAQARLLASGISVLTTEMVIFEWLEQAGTPAFKDVAPLLR